VQASELVPQTRLCGCEAIDRFVQSIRLCASGSRHIEREEVEQPLALSRRPSLSISLKPGVFLEQTRQAAGVDREFELMCEQPF